MQIGLFREVAPTGNCSVGFSSFNRALPLAVVASLLLTPIGLKGATPLDPGPRIGHATAFDEERGRVVLFGGFGQDGIPLGDTWEWNGRNWQRVSELGPAPRKWAVMAYDSEREWTVLFGGLEGFGRTGDSLGDTWAWDGKSWQQLASKGPSARDHHAMVYDRARDRLVLFGGWDGGAESVVDDTWEWTEKAWVRVMVTAPPARAAHAMVYDESRGVTVLFGGRSGGKFLNDTWLWDGQQWSQVETQGPASRAFHAMAYNSHRRKTLLFGGRVGSRLFGDTWTWDGSSWTNVDVPGPSERYAYSMAYDRSRAEAMFFGGGHRDQESGVWVLHDDTWLWDGDSWRRVDSSGSLPREGQFPP